MINFAVTAIDRDSKGAVIMQGTQQDMISLLANAMCCNGDAGSVILAATALYLEIQGIDPDKFAKVIKQAGDNTRAQHGSAYDEFLKKRRTL